MTVHEQVAAFALGALDDDERTAFEEHLAGCEQCAVQLESLTPVAAALAFAVDAPAPPPALRERLLDAAREERQKVVPLHRRWTVPLLPAVAAAAACLAIGLGLWAADRGGAPAVETAVAIAAAPDSQRVGVADARGTLVVHGDDTATLVLVNLRSAPANSTWQAWVIEDGRPGSAGVFRADGTAIVALTRRVPRGAVVAVTLEPGAGSDTPKGPMVLRSEQL